MLVMHIKLHEMNIVIEKMNVHMRKLKSLTQSAKIYQACSLHAVTRNGTRWSSAL